MPGLARTTRQTGTVRTCLTLSGILALTVGHALNASVSKIPDSYEATDDRVTQHLRGSGRYALPEAAWAHSDLEARRTTGKLLLTLTHISSASPRDVRPQQLRALRCPLPSLRTLSATTKRPPADSSERPVGPGADTPLEITHGHQQVGIHWQLVTVEHESPQVRLLGPRWSVAERDRPRALPVAGAGPTFDQPDSRMAGRTLCRRRWG